jgi:Mrp family chromosome partitioning ATPase
MLFSRKKESVRAPQNLLGEQTVHTHFAEAYRTLRTNVHFASVDQSVSSLMITSAGPGEGKTSVSANLGWTLARQSKSVVLVDCDLRRPCLSKTVDSSSSIGLIGLTADILGSSINESIASKGCALPDLLTLIDLQKKTGKLLVRDAAEAFELFFLKGRIADLAWLTCPQHLEPPLLLHREGFLNKEQLALAVKQQDDAGRQLGGMISGMGFADRKKLRSALALHAAEALQRLTAMTAPAFQFTELPAQHISVEAAELADLPQQTARMVFSRNELPYIDSCIRQAVVQADEHLFVLPAGPIPPNPSEMAGSLRLHFILSRLKQLYDFLIIDTPPVLPVSDALLLAPHADGVVLTVKTGFMHRNIISKAVEQLRDAKANLLGLVLNQVDSKRDSYYHSSYHKYASSYYGEQGR